MRKFLLCLAVMVSISANAKKVTYKITDFGAHSGEVCTEAIQAAIDKCAFDGGGMVIVPKGCFYSATIYLRDKVNLHISKGGVLKGVEDESAYEPYIPANDLSRYDSGGGTANANCVNDRQWMKALIIGDRVDDASITGPGTIDGSHVFDPKGEEGMRGPHMIIVAEADDFRLANITLTCASNYAFLGYALEEPVFENLIITEGWDGIHIRGAEDAVIRNCVFKTGDDSIAGGYWEDMKIENCDINSSCNGIRIIMPCRELEVRNCTFHGPGAYPHRTSGSARRDNMLFGISLEPGAWGAASGIMEKIYLHNLKMSCLDAPISISVREGTYAKDLTLENIRATGVKGSLETTVHWNDLGFETINVKNCKYSR